MPLRSDSMVITGYNISCNVPRRKYGKNSVRKEGLFYYICKLNQTFIFELVICVYISSLPNIIVSQPTAFSIKMIVTLFIFAEEKRPIILSRR